MMQTKGCPTLLYYFVCLCVPELDLHTECVFRGFRESSLLWPGASECAGRRWAILSGGLLHPRLWACRPIQSRPVSPAHRLLLVCSGGHRPAHSWNLHQVLPAANSFTTSPEFPKIKRTMSLGFVGLSGYVLPLNRYETPECDGAARSRVLDTDDPFQGRDLTGLNHFTPPNTSVPPCSPTNILVPANHLHPRPVMVIGQIRPHAAHNIINNSSLSPLFRTSSTRQNKGLDFQLILSLHHSFPQLSLCGSSALSQAPWSGRGAGFIEWRRTPDCATDVWRVLWRLWVLRERRWVLGERWRLLVVLEEQTANLTRTVNECCTWKLFHSSLQGSKKRHQREAF